MVRSSKLQASVTLRVRRGFHVLCLAAIFSLPGCGGGGDSVEPEPQNVAPTAHAGEDQEADELTEVSLDGSGSSDSDGTIVSYSWSQTSTDSIRVSIQNADAVTATFQAPEVTEDTVLEFELQVEDNEGGVSSDTIQVEVANVELRIFGRSSSFGWHGDSIEIEVAGLGSATHGDIEVLLGGDPVSPTSIDSGSVEFVIPDDAQGHGLHVRARGQLSNGVPFTIRESGLVPPDEEDFTEDENGVKVVTTYLIVQLHEDYSSIEAAERIARSLSGEVIGRFDFMRWWQISVPGEMSIDELSQMAETIRSRSEVADAFLDHAGFTSNEIDWTGDPDSGVRELNNVETGADLYSQQVGPAANAAVTPFFMAINLMEVGGKFGIDFEVDDFVGPRTDIYAFANEGNPQVRHATNVAGVIAAELVADASARGDNPPGNAGVVRALQRSHGGANITVEDEPSFSTKFSSLKRMLEQIGRPGVGVINWSWGYIYVNSGALACDGNESGADYDPTRKWRRDGIFDWFRWNSTRRQFREFLRGLSRDYPNVVVVQAAGNDQMNVDFTIHGSGGQAADNLIVVGAHTVDDTEHESASEVCFSDQQDTRIKRAWYSNFGDRVDIAAGGKTYASKCAENEPGCTTAGTSFAAPVVAGTVALMQSINPNLSPAEIRALLRRSATPIDANQVSLDNGAAENFVRPLTADESSTNQSKGAMLNMQGAIQAALDSLEEATLPIGEEVRVQLPSATQETRVNIEVEIPDREGTAFNRADIMFLVDVTGSYRDDIETFRRRAGDIASASQSFGADVHVGLASFSTIPGSPWGGRNDYPYRLDLPLSKDGEGLGPALQEVEIVSYFFSLEQRESQLDALFEVADDADVGWRQGSLRLVFLATDESFTDKDIEPSYPGKGYMETREKLEEHQIQVWGLTSGGSLDDVSRIAGDTGGRQIALSRDSSEIVEAITEAVIAEASDLSVRLVPYGDFYRLVRKIKPLDEPDATECVLKDTDPSDCDPKTGVNPGDRVRFEVAFQGNAALSGGPRRLSFRLQVDANKGAIVTEIPVTVDIP